MLFAYEATVQTIDSTATKNELSANWNAYERLRALAELPTAHTDSVNVVEAIRDGMRCRALSEGKKYWGDKAPPFLNRIDELRLYFPTAKIIHLVRDPRPNAKSLRDRQYQHLELAANYWCELNQSGLGAGLLLDDSAYLLLRYEDLLSAPEAALKRVCDFLDINYDPEMISKLATATNTNLPGAYVKKQLDTGKISSWKTHLPEREVEKIEKQCGRLMDHLGYSRLVEPAIAHQPLKAGRKLWLELGDAWRLLWLAKRRVMLGRTLESQRIPFSKRVAKFFSTVGRLIFSESVVEAMKK